MMREKKTVLDLFCGCGGLSYGFIEAGYEVLLGIDHWKEQLQLLEKIIKNHLGL